MEYLICYGKTFIWSNTFFNSRVYSRLSKYHEIDLERIFNAYYPRTMGTYFWSTFLLTEGYFCSTVMKSQNNASKFKCIKIKFLSKNGCIKFYVYQFRNLKKAWLQWLSIFQIFRQKFLFDPLAFFMEMFFTHQFMHTTLFWPTSFYWGLLLIHYRESSKEMARKCIKKGSHW